MSSRPLYLSGRALVFDERGEILLLQRASTSRSFPGLWEFPGGKNDPGEAFDTALRREVTEETGLRVELGRVIGAGEHTTSDRRIAYLFLAAKIVGGELRLSPEHDAFAWVEVSELNNHRLFPPFAEFVTTYRALLRE